MVTRRQVLRGSTMVAAVGITAASAGCLTDAEEEYNEAIDLINANGEILDEVRLQSDLPSSFNPDRVHRRADDAEIHLDTAEDETDDEDLGVMIENARHHLDIQRHEADIYASMIDILECLDTMASYAEVERWDDARTEIDSCRPLVGDVEESFSQIEASLQQIDANYLEEDGGHRKADLEEALAEVEPMMSALTDMMDGLSEFMLAAGDMQTGVEYFDSEQYRLAASSFEDSHRLFEESERILENVDDDTLTTDMRASFIEMECFADAAGDAMEDMMAAANAADARNYRTAEDHLSSAEQAFDRC